MSKLCFSDQVSFVCASMALHNFIHRNSETDEATLTILDDDDYVAPQMLVHHEYLRVADMLELGDSTPEMGALRANITYALGRQARM